MCYLNRGEIGPREGESVLEKTELSVTLFTNVSSKNINTMLWLVEGNILMEGRGGLS